MMKGITFSVFLVIALVGAGFLGNIRMMDPVEAGNELEFYLNVKNPTKMSFDDTNVKMYFMDLDGFYAFPGFDLDPLETNGFRYDVPMPVNAEPGYYVMKVVASNEDFRDSKYVYVDIR